MAEIKTQEQYEKELEDHKSISQRWTDIRQDIIKLLNDIEDKTTLVIYMNTLEMVCQIMREQRGLIDPKTVNL